MRAETSIESVRDAVHHYRWVEHRVRTIVLESISIVLIAGSLVCIGLSGIFPELGLAVLLSPIAIGLAASIQVSKLVTLAKIRMRFFEQMAGSFGLSLSGNAHLDTVSGHLFAFGHSRGIFQVFAGTHSGHDVRFYTYVFTTGSGKSRVTRSLRVFETDCHTELLEIMVHPKSVTPGGMSWQPRGTRPLKLEGLFNKQFEVFVPEGMEIEALQILEPHHMERLMQQYSDMGFYCHGTKLYLFTDAHLPTTRTEFEKLIALVDELYDALVPELHAVSGDVTALREAFARSK